MNKQDLLFLNRGKLIARLAFGGMMIPHGVTKLQKWMQGGEVIFPDPIGLGPEFSLSLTIFAELLCAIFIVIGLFTRWSSIPPMITMMVAAFVIHADDPWSRKEFALLYLAGFLVILLLGPGKYSIDQMIKNRKVNK